VVEARCRYGRLWILNDAQHVMLSVRMDMLASPHVYTGNFAMALCVYAQWRIKVFTVRIALGIEMTPRITLICSSTMMNRY
jgi:hypothetical protein